MARDEWTDARIDDLNSKVDRGFEAVDKRFDKVDEKFDKVYERFDRVEERFDERFDRVEERFDERFDRVEERSNRKFERVEDDIKEFRVEMNARLDSQYEVLLAQNRLLVISMISLFGCMFTGFAGLIAAQIWV